MLLRHTPTKIIDRQALTVNPAKTCQPIGAMYAALGIHRCLPHSHGSQGCCAYHRSTLTRHYKEPVYAATSSFTEGSSVFGGQSNLLAALDTMFTVYNPDVVAVHTTCLSETIGDDIPQIVRKAAEEGKIPAGKHVFHANTPSYAGSHVTGFASMCTAMVRHFARCGEARKNQYNILPGWVEPADMREIKRLTAAMGIAAVVFPDTSGILDAPLTGQHEFYPAGGATVEAMTSSGDSLHTFALGPACSAQAAHLLDTQCKVRCKIMDLPLGLHATDRFIDTIRRVAGVAVPDSITYERGSFTLYSRWPMPMIFFFSDSALSSHVSTL